MPDDRPDYYAVLGVARDAPFEDIRRAYRSLAARYHPDTAGETADNRFRFHQVTEAYRILSDVTSRRAYDHGFRPVESVQDLQTTLVGRRIADWLLPRGPASPRQGADLCLVVRVPSKLLDQGGSVMVTLPEGAAPMVQGAERTFPIPVPSDVRLRPWCRLRSLGGAGINGGNAGNLFIRFTFEEEKK